MIFNAILRKKARAALKPMMPIVVLCALIANIPSLLSQTIGVLTGSDPMTYLLSQVTTDAELMALLSSNEMIFAAFEQFLTPNRLLSLGLNVISWLISPVLMLGLTNCFLLLLRGQEIQVTTVFSRVKCFLKSILLNLWTALKIVLWSIPGGAVMVLGGVLAILTQQAALLSLYFVGLVLMTVLMIRAMLHYTMSTIFLADDPSLGVFASVKASIAMMRHRKMALLSLTLSIYAWLIVLAMVESLLAGLFGPVIASTLYMAAQLVISVYMQTAQCAFYEAYRVKQA